MRSTFSTITFAMAFAIFVLNAGLATNRSAPFGSLVPTAGPHLADHPRTID
jgi:hypothetical protein